MTASVLLDGLEKDNQADKETGERVNGTVCEKIDDARGWFEILCGVGEDGQWPEENLRMFIRQALSVLESQIEQESEETPCAHFKRWPSTSGSPATWDGQKVQ